MSMSKHFCNMRNLKMIMTVEGRDLPFNCKPQGLEQAQK